MVYIAIYFFILFAPAFIPKKRNQYRQSHEFYKKMCGISPTFATDRQTERKKRIELKPQNVGYFSETFFSGDGDIFL